MDHSINWPEPRRAYWEGLVLSVAGLVLLSATGQGGISGLLCLPGGAVVLAAGVGMLLFPGDARLPQFGALGALLMLPAVPALALAGAGGLAFAALLSAAVAFVAAGWYSLRTYPRVEGAPEVEPAPLPATHVAVDEALIGFFIAVAKPPRGEQTDRILGELEAWEEWLKSRKLRGRYQGLHTEPPPLLKVESTRRRFLRHEYRHVEFSSEYAGHEDMPGAARWRTQGHSHAAHAWVLEHPGPARPWLLTIHGYRMGEPWLDLSLFDPSVFHHRYGLNMASLVLPLHGPRRRGLISGAGYLEGEFMDFVHAEFQAMWDARRLLSWLRLVKHAPAVGVYGVSLGGYNTGLLSGLDKDLACAVAGVPVVSMANTLWRHFPVHERRAMEDRGVDVDRLEKAFAPVAPTSFKAQLGPERLGIFAGSIDRLVWPDDPLRLQQHWGNPELVWYDGSHLSFLLEPDVRALIRRTLTAGGLIDPEGRPVTTGD